MTRTPALFLSHGAPPLADDPIWPNELKRWAGTLEKPRAILMVSAHWETRPAAVSAYEHTVPLLYDFWGFPDHYYTVQYPAPLAPDLAREVQAILGEGLVARDETRGLDHGAYVPLVEMFPDADIPTIQLSLPTLEPKVLFELGQKLAPLRDQGVLIIGSGFTTHNLRWFRPSRGPQPVPTVSQEFDHWAAEAVANQDIDSLLNFAQLAPAPDEAHPRTEHWAPLYVTLGAADGAGSLENKTTVDGFWFGLSKRSWQFD